MKIKRFESQRYIKIYIYPKTVSTENKFMKVHLCDKCGKVPPSYIGTGGYKVCPPMNSRIIEVGGIADISSGDRATM